MSEQIIEVEADSLEEAREKVKSQIPDGLELLSEQIISDGKPKSKTKEVIKIEADSQEEARKQIEAHITEGLYLLSERVISDGTPKTEKANGQTTEIAFEKARSEIPSSATIIENIVIADPEQKIIAVAAPDESLASSSARFEARHQFGDNALVNNIRLVNLGNKGFLGIGRKNNQYEAEVLLQATVEIVYKPKVKVSFEIGEIYKTKAKVSARIGRRLTQEEVKTIKLIDSWLEKITDDNEFKNELVLHELISIGMPAVNPIADKIMHLSFMANYYSSQQNMMGYQRQGRVCVQLYSALAQIAKSSPEADIRVVDSLIYILNAPVNVEPVIRAGAAVTAELRIGSKYAIDKLKENGFYKQKEEFKEEKSLAVKIEEPAQPANIHSSSHSSTHKWIRHGNTLTEIAKEKHAQLETQFGREVEFRTIDNFYELIQNNEPGVFTMQAVDEKAYIIARMQTPPTNIADNFISKIQGGNVIFVSSCHTYPTYPMTYLRIFIPLEAGLHGIANGIIIESPTDFANANFQEWVCTLEATKKTVLLVYNECGNVLVEGKIDMKQETINEVVHTVDQANIALVAIPKEQRDFRSASQLFFRDHPQPFI